MTFALFSTYPENFYPIIITLSNTFLIKGLEFVCRFFGSSVPIFSDLAALTILVIL